MVEPIKRGRYIELMTIAQEVAKSINERVTGAHEVATVLDLVEDILNNPK